MSEQDIVERLWASDEANALTNEAARAFEAIRAELAAEKEAREEAEATSRDCLKSLSAEAKLRGEAEGKLAGSELAGVVEGWREKCEALSAKLEAAKEALTRIEYHGLNGKMGHWGLGDIARTTLATLEGDT